MDLQEKVSKQREKIQNGNPTIELVDSCRLENGILKLSNDEVSELSEAFTAICREKEITFFTPASGSGSRMFKALFTALDNQDSSPELCQQLLQLPLIQNLSSESVENLKAGSAQKALEEILKTEHLNYGNTPKGLIPFHFYDSKVRNPFQEHLIQSETIGGQASHIHFTINADFESAIIASIAELSEKRKVSFSEQDPSTNSIAFDDQLEPATDENDNIITRPAGHGALIHNLNAVDADLILIRNIDNMQHQDKANTSTLYRRALGAKLELFKEEVHNVLSKISRDHAFESSIKLLNESYQLHLTEKQLASPTAAFDALNRPIRVCGMVKNEGEPGGGPFWVKSSDGSISRQIIEKSQISDSEAHQKMVQDATHFNPVELMCAVKDFRGEKFDLTEFVDENQFFIVHKTQGGQNIQYIEQPGLWNGAMANWITLFYEIPADCFSPVKSVFDLLQPLHQAD